MNLTALLRSKTGILSIASVAAAGLYLIIEYQALVIELLPWLLVMACPLMHVFMHKGHGGHSAHQHENAGQADRSPNGTTSRPERPE